MASEWMDWGFVTWKPNTNQQVQLQDGSILVTMLDADYPAIGTTKNLSGIAKCECRSEAFVGWTANLSGTLACQTKGTLVKLTTGKEEVSASIRCTASTIRLAFQGADDVFQAPGKTNAGGSTPYPGRTTVGQAADNNGQMLYVSVSTDNTTMTLYRVDYATNSYTSEVIATAGTAWGATTLTTTHLASFSTTSNGPGHIAVDSAGVVHLVWSVLGASLFIASAAFYWRSDTKEKVYLNTPASAMLPAGGSIMVLCASASTIHIIYCSYLRSGGKDYHTAAMISRNGTTWTAPARLATIAWQAGNWATLGLMAFYIDATDRSKIYLCTDTLEYVGSTNPRWITWVDLNARTTSTTRILTSVGGTNQTLKTRGGKVYEAWDYGTFSFLASSAAADQFMEYRIQYTLAAWQTPSILTYNVGGSFSDQATWGMVKINEVWYYTRYEVFYIAGFNAVYAYHRVATTWGSDFFYAGQVLGITLNGASQGTIDCSDLLGPETGANAVCLGNFANAVTVKEIRWGVKSFAVHLNGTLRGEAAASMELTVLTDTVAVELDGILQATSAATLDLTVADSQYLEASIAALVTVFLELRTTNAVPVDASISAIASATLNLYAGKTLLSALLASDHRGYLNLNHVRDVRLTLNAAGAEASALLDAVVLRRLAASIAAEASASLAPSYSVRLSGSNDALAVAALTLALEKRLQAAVTSTATAALNIARTSSVKGDGVPVYTKSDPSFVSTSYGATWVKTRK